MDCNLFVLAGTLATKPELREFESGKRLLRLLVTTRIDNPRKRTDVLPVVIWDPPDAPDPGNLTVGTRIWATGSVQRRFWESGSGRQSRVELVANHLTLEPDTREQKVEK